MSNGPTCPFKPDDLDQQGSEWVLANFHTHTPSSRDYAKDLVPNGSLTHEKIARGILEDCLTQGVHVLAITDHNSPSFARIEKKGGGFAVDPERESYYALMRSLIQDEPDKYGDILVLPGAEIGAENIHVLALFPPTEDPGWDVLKIAAILDEGNCRPEFYGDHLKSCTDLSVADAIDIVHNRGGIAIPAHIDGASGFLEEEKSSKRLLSLIVSRPHLFAVEYIRDTAREKIDKLMGSKFFWDIVEARGGRSIAWTQSSDAHFVRAFKATQKGNGKPIGTENRRTWLRLDPNALSFEAVRAALLDPENRVRVDETRRPRGRQGPYRPVPSYRTYARALRVDWGNRQKEIMSFNPGINAIVGPPGRGKGARAQAFTVVGGMTDDLCVSAPRTSEKGPGSEAISPKSIDVIFERGVGSSGNALWWLHREDAARVYVARVKPDGNRIKIQGTGKWVELAPNGKFDRLAVRKYFDNLSPAQARLAPAIPQVFSLRDICGLLQDAVRVARFIEWHYVPDDHLDKHRELHEELRSLTLNPGNVSAPSLSTKLKSLFTKLSGPREEAKTALGAFYKASKIGLFVTWRSGKWSDNDVRRSVAEELLAMNKREPSAVFNILRKIEDRALLRLKIDSSKKDEIEGIETALKGLLLVVGARDLGPIVMEAPEAHVEPAVLTEVLAPLLLHARDAGAQFVGAIDDTNLPFAVDADLLLVCKRDPDPDHAGRFDTDATGPLEKGATAMWALRNLDGGGNQFSRRDQLYSSVLGEALAARQKKRADVVFKLGNRKSQVDEGRGH